MMIDKIKVLVGNDEVISSIAYEQERILVVWVLMTRLSQEDLNEVWSKFQEPLLRVAKTLLQEKQLDHCYNLYIRLIAQVTSRIDDAYPYELGLLLFDAWKAKKESSESPSSPELDIDVYTSLDIFMKRHGKRANPNDVLETIWNNYTSCNVVPAKITDDDDDVVVDVTIKESDQSNNSTPPSEKDKDDKDYEEWNLMSQTLKEILQDSSSEGLDEQVLYMFQTHGYQYLPERMFPSLLKWISPKKPSSHRQFNILPFELRSLWFELFMGLVQSRISNNSNQNKKNNDPSSSSFQMTLRRNGFPEELNQFLLAHIVSPIADSDSLRTLAWQTVVDIVDAYGWGWIVPKASKNSSSLGKLGATKNLCAWVRLASGEWRIQLQSEASNFESEETTTTTTTTNMKVTANPIIGNACARLLINAVQFFVDLQETNFRESSLSNDAILHLRQSLEECLMTTVEYVKMERENPESVFSTISIRLFGSLLREVDIWNLLEKDDSTVQAIIICLQSILPKVDDYSLLPGLTNILATADSDQTKQAQLTHLWEPLIIYLERFWKANGRIKPTAQQLAEWDDTIPWACSCIELWVDNNNIESKNSLPNKLRLQHGLIDFIRIVLQLDSSTNNQRRSHLSLAVGCYMTLSEEQQKPSEDEAQLIFHALEFCEMG